MVLLSNCLTAGSTWFTQLSMWSDGKTGGHPEKHPPEPPYWGAFGVPFFSSLFICSCLSVPCWGAQHLLCYFHQPTPFGFQTLDPRSGLNQAFSVTCSYGFWLFSCRLLINLFPLSTRPITHSSNLSQQPINLVSLVRQRQERKETAGKLSDVCRGNRIIVRFCSFEGKA